MEIKKQKNEKECGLYVIEYFIRKLWSKRVSFSTLRNKVEFSENGISLQQLTKLGREYKIEIRSFEVSAQDLFDSNPKKEFIALINSDGYNHYVVCKIKFGKAIIKDPAKGKIELTFGEFQRKFINVASFVEKVGQQEVIKKEKDIIIASTKPKLFFIGSVVVAVSTILMFISTIFTKLIIDKVLPHHLNDMLVFSLIVFVVIAAMRVACMALKGLTVKRIQNLYEIELTKAFLEKVFNANKELNKFTQNDILRRWSFIMSISAMFANGFFVIFSEALIFISSFAILIWISSNVFAIVLAFSLLIVINIFAFSFVTRSKTDELLPKQLAHLNASHDFIRNLVFLKNPLTFSKLSTIVYQTKLDAKKFEMNLFNINLLHRVFCELLTLTLPITITFICSTLIFDNKLTVGEMMLMISSSTFFFGSLNDISGFIFSYITFRKESKLFDELINIKDEEKNINGITLRKISNIEFNDFSFSYDRKIFAIPQLMIDSDTKIVGHNGSGKSTFLKCIANLISGSGSLKFNGLSHNLYSLDSLRSNVILITSDIYLPKQSVMEYLCDSKENRKIFEDNIRRLPISEIVANSKIDLNMDMLNGGLNFSSGQRQIIMLLKVFAQTPKILLLDEAFENVDTSNFELFKTALASYEEKIIEVSHSKRFVREGKEVNFELYSKK